jgi:integrase
MASKPLWNSKRGTWSVQYWDGYPKREVVVKRQPGWKVGDPPPKKIPAEAYAAVGRLAEKEKLAKTLRRTAEQQTLSIFLKAHLATYKKASSHDAVKVAVELFLEWCETRKISKVEDVTDEIAQAWVDHCAESEEIAIQTSKNRIGRLAPAWTRAIVKKKLLVNPWKHTEPRGTPTRRTRRHWTPAQFDKLIHASRPWLRDILIVGVYTGIRISAMSQLLWSDIVEPTSEQEAYGRIDIRTEINKTEGYKLPIHPRLHEVLKRRMIHKSPGHDRIICGHHGRPTSRGVTAQSIRRACKRAGLPDPDSPNHHMRRTFGRWAVSGHLTGSPVPVYVVSKWFGHASVKMTQKYLDLEDDDSTRFMVGLTQS